MWIRRAVWQALTDQVSDMHASFVQQATLTAQAQVQLAIAQNNFEWARNRLNAVEIERAQLLSHLAGINPVVPSVETSGPTYTQSVVEFNDMGDEAAAAAGVSWNPDGTVSETEADQ